jgi:uroporphyrin-III C-methyltransferase/precorrin-2 dehydrogenase/sirohydrochlorin ferrochelatase
VEGGIVYLVGAGPGDPGLMTRRSLELIAAADAILYDRLIPGGALDGARPDAELRYVGKEPGSPAVAQEEINELLVSLGRAGKRVVRLKGGDPFVFGRGGEEVLACAEAGVPVTVVPGVTSAVAAPAAAGIPVTHRGVAHEFVVVSGHLRPGHRESLVDWPALARLHGTLCVLMGLKHLAGIAEVLLREGRSPSTPVAVVQDGTTGTQRVVTATLATVAAAVEEHAVRPPAVIVIGPTVATLPPVLPATVPPVLPATSPPVLPATVAPIKEQRS